MTDAASAPRGATEEAARIAELEAEVARLKRENRRLGEECNTLDEECGRLMARIDAMEDDAHISRHIAALEAA